MEASNTPGNSESDGVGTSRWRTFLGKWGWVLSGLAVLSTGYVPLLIMWSAGYGPRGEEFPGFFSFPSATWGDGLCLPAMAAALVWMNQKLGKPTTHKVQILAALVGAVGAIVGMGLWLLDPDPGLNWTIPAAHTYNEPGWVHAAFFVAASSLFSLLWADFISRLRSSAQRENGEAKVQEILGSGAFAVAVGCAAAFAYLATLDSLDAGQTRASGASLVLLILFAFLLVLGLVFAVGKRISYALRSMVAAAIIAFSIVFTALTLHPDAVVVSLVAAAGAFGFAVGMGSELRTTGRHPDPVDMVLPTYPPMPELFAVPAVFVLVPLQASRTSSENILELYAVLGWLLVAIIVTLAFQWQRHGSSNSLPGVRWLFTATLFVLITSGALVFWKMGQLDKAGVATSLAFATLAALLAGPAIRLCESDLKQVIKVEQTDDYIENKGFTARQLPLIWRLYARLAACAVAATGSVLGLALLTGYAVGWNRGGGILLPTQVESFTVGAAVVGSVALVVWARWCQGRTDPAGSPFSRLAITGGIFAISSLLLGSVILVGVPFEIWAALQSLGIAAFAGECVLSNGLRLGLVEMHKRSYAIVAGVALGIFAIAYWSLTKGIGTTSQPVLLWQSVIGLLACLAVAGAFTVGATSTIYGKLDRPNRSFSERAGNASQDFLMLSLMWILMAWLPRTIYAHVPDNPAVPLYKWVMVGMVFAGFLALYLSALLWMIKTNDGHVGRKRARKDLDVPLHFRPEATHWHRLASTPERLNDYFQSDRTVSEEERESRALASHTAVQNGVSLTLVLLTVLGALWLAITDWEV